MKHVVPLKGQLICADAAAVISGLDLDIADWERQRFEARNDLRMAEEWIRSHKTDTDSEGLAEAPKRLEQIKKTVEDSDRRATELRRIRDQLRTELRPK